MQPAKHPMENAPPKSSTMRYGHGSSLALIINLLFIKFLFYDFIYNLKKYLLYFYFKDTFLRFNIIFFIN